MCLQYFSECINRERKKNIELEEKLAKMQTEIYYLKKQIDK